MNAYNPSNESIPQGEPNLSTRFDFGLYAVLTNPAAGWEACAAAAVERGVRYLQLRMKDAPRGEALSTARRIKRITDGTSTLFIVNDDAELALEAGADGAHFGQEDLPPDFVRSAFAELKVIGISTHNAAQARAAAALRPDYIGVGPVFATPTKKNHAPALGIEETARIIKASSVPALAIGGIRLANIAALAAAGIRNMAVVSEICGSPAPRAAIVSLQAAIAAKLC